LPLVNEMLDAVAKYGDKGIWTNPNLKILDPAAGIGNFPLVAYEKLMAGLPRTKGLKTDEERRRHILENMLYMVELNGNNVRLMKKIFGGDKYRLNIVKGDFLEDKTQEKLHQILGTNELKFDFVMGNPPFQETGESGERKALNHNLYSKFVLRSHQILREDGFIDMITPTSFGAPNNEMFQLLRGNDLLYIDTNIKQRFFSSIGSTFCYFILKNTRRQSSKLICNDVEITMNKSRLICLPNVINKESLSILNKFFKLNNNFKFIYNSQLHRTGKTEMLSDTKTAVFKYPVKHTSIRTSTIYSDRKTNHDMKKILVSISGTPDFMYNAGQFGTTQGTLYHETHASDDINQMLYILNSKLYKYVLKIAKWSGFNSPIIYEMLPLPETYKQLFSEKAIYDAFGISQREVKEIEQHLQVKKAN